MREGPPEALSRGSEAQYSKLKLLEAELLYRSFGIEASGSSELGLYLLAFFARCQSAGE
jgi:hypothetical protein